MKKKLLKFSIPKGRQIPLKVVLTGPECSGKTHMSVLMSEKLGWPLIPEVSRYFPMLHTDYTLADVMMIFKEQCRVIDLAMASRSKGVVCDTDVLTFVVWIQYLFEEVPREVMKRWYTVSPAAYLLCKPDIPFVLDPLRENGASRDTLFDIYLQHLLDRKHSFSIIAGDEEMRWKEVHRILNMILPPNYV